MGLSQEVSSGYWAYTKLLICKSRPALPVTVGDTTRGRACQSTLPCLYVASILYLCLCAVSEPQAPYECTIPSIARHPVLDAQGVLTKGHNIFDSTPTPHDAQTCAGEASVPHTWFRVLGDGNRHISPRPFTGACPTLEWMGFWLLDSRATLSFAFWTFLLHSQEIRISPSQRGEAAWVLSIYKLLSAWNCFTNFKLHYTLWEKKEVTYNIQFHTWETETVRLSNFCKAR